MRATVMGFLVYAILVLGSLVQAFACYEVLPDRVASHFNAAGEPDGWQSKGTLLLTHVGLIAGMTFGFLPLVYFGVRFGPASLIGMPRKEFWLAEPHQRETRASLARYVLWAMNLTLALLAAFMEMTCRANLSEKPHLGSGPWLCLAVYSLAIGVWLVSFYRRFGKRSMQAASSDKDGRRGKLGS